MRYGRLPEFQKAKDDEGNALPNRVTVTNALIGKGKGPEKDGKPTDLEPLKIEFAANLMEFPQYDTLAEFIQACGSDVRALEVVNEVTEKFATASGKTTIRTATSGSAEDIIAAGLRDSKNYSWVVENKMSVKDKAQNFDAIMALVGTIPAEELAKRLAELSGK